MFRISDLQLPSVAEILSRHNMEKALFSHRYAVEIGINETISAIVTEHIRILNERTLALKEVGVNIATEHIRILNERTLALKEIGAKLKIMSA